MKQPVYNVVSVEETKKWESVDRTEHPEKYEVKKAKGFRKLNLKPVPKSVFMGEVFNPQSSKLLTVNGLFKRTTKSHQVFVSAQFLNGHKAEFTPAELICREQYLKGAVYAEIVQIEKPIIEERTNFFQDGQFAVYMVKVVDGEFLLTLINGTTSQTQKYSGSYSGCLEYCKNYLVKKNAELKSAEKFLAEIKTLDPLTGLQRLNNLPIPVQIIVMERMKAL